jgi:hypothetical protein
MQSNVLLLINWAVPGHFCPCHGSMDSLVVAVAVSHVVAVWWLLQQPECNVAWTAGVCAAKATGSVRYCAAHVLGVVQGAGRVMKPL